MSDIEPMMDSDDESQFFNNSHEPNEARFKPSVAVNKSTSNQRPQAKYTNVDDDLIRDESTEYLSATYVSNQNNDANYNHDDSADDEDEEEMMRNNGLNQQNNLHLLKPDEPDQDYSNYDLFDNTSFGFSESTRLE
jgi:hypothetical protein